MEGPEDKNNEESEKTPGTLSDIVAVGSASSSDEPDPKDKNIFGGVLGGSVSANGKVKQPRGVHAVDWTVLYEMRELFARRLLEEAVPLEIDGEEPAVTAQELTDCWLQVAESEQKKQGTGPLSARDRDFIGVRVSQSMREVDVNGTKAVDKDEWLHHMLLTRSSPRTMKAMMQINTLLDSAVDQCPGILVGLQHGFEVAQQAASETERESDEEGHERAVEGGDDLPGRGRLPVAEVLNIFGSKLWQFRPRPPAAGSSKGGFGGFSATVVDDFVTDIIKGLEIEGQISYADFLGLALGRRERQVLLHLYDLSKGVASALSPWLIDQRVQGVWHTGLVVYGKEYYFGGDIYYDVPGRTGFGKPARVVLLGHTLRQREELHAFIVDELKPFFSRDAYDAARNNCNHFTDRVSMYLIGKHIPEEVLRQPELLVNTKLGQTLRPVLNRWLGFYFEPDASAEQVSRAERKVRNFDQNGGAEDLIEGEDDIVLGPAVNSTIQL